MKPSQDRLSSRIKLLRNLVGRQNGAARAARGAEEAEALSVQELKCPKIGQFLRCLLAKQTE
jgi:hypothetical protein